MPVNVELIIKRKTYLIFFKAELSLNKITQVITVIKLLFCQNNFISISLQ